jgi:hypothetical protein
MLCAPVAAASPAPTDEPVDLPAVLLESVPFDVVPAQAHPALVLVVNDTMAIADEQGAWRDLVVTDVDHATFELRRGDELVFSVSRPVVPGWISLLPPIAAIVLAFLLRSVIPALFVGILAGAWAINGMTWYGAFTGFFETFTVYTLNAAIDPDHAKILLFGFMIGGMIGIVSRNGGPQPCST